jgi:hypothetical protein
MWAHYLGVLFGGFSALMQFVFAGRRRLAGVMKVLRITQAGREALARSGGT